MKQFTILVADDDDDDFIIMKDAFEDLHQPHLLDHVSDGQKIFSYLQKSIDQQKLPDLILLDINMPRMDGIEALRRIKRSEEFRSIPILMYSTSNDTEQMRKCYQLGANGFVTKGASYKIVLTFANHIINFLSGRQAIPGSLTNNNKNSIIT